MARRRFGDEARSALAVWAGRLAWFSLVVAALSVIIVRSALLEIQPALATFGAALLFAFFAILLALLSFIGIWRQGLKGLGSALLAIGIGLALLAYPAYLGYRAYRLPAINDITTDFNDPPRFTVTASMRPRGASYPGKQAADKQRAAYPDIEPLQLSVSAQAAFEAAITVITKRKWLVVDARAPTPQRREGTIEAVARTPIMGFRDDVSIRIRPISGGCRVDVRSASRYGIHDFGANASRVRALTEDIDDTVSSMPADKRAPPEPEKPAPGQRRQPQPRR
ncbi:MAG TPA: DUF1499 domain-containing protein [Pseudolabrys sp.]|nr:DUF1499 domain-containing protein [Pseudolabrys sp.]